MVGEKGAEIGTGMLALALQGGNERQIEFLFPGQELKRCERSLDLGQPRGAALLNGFNSRPLPFPGLVSGMSVIEPGDHTLGEQRDDARDAQLGGLLDDRFEDFSLGNGLQQSDLAGPRRGGTLL